MSVLKGLALAAVVGLAYLPTTASAEFYEVRTTPNTDRCFQVTYHQQIERVNTMGRLARGPSRSTTGGYAKPVGGFYRDSYNPPLYLETRRVVSPEHFSAAPAGCP